MNNHEHEDTAAKAIASTEFAWGSFQYDDVAALYEKMCTQEAEFGRDKMLTEYGIKVGKVQPFEGDVLEGFKESLCIDVVDREVVGDDTSEFRKTCEHIKTVTEALNFLRDQSWDLWCGIPYITKFVFPELDVSNVYREDEMGVKCWLFKAYGFVADDEPFKGWDT